MPQANLTAVQIASTSTPRRQGHLMSPPENGLRERVGYHDQEIRRLWEEKASKEALAAMAGDFKEMKQAVESIEGVIAARPAERERERRADMAARKADQEAAARERKIDRRWRLGTALSCVTILIAAAAVLLPALGGG